jgi:hypothetical protein
LDLSKLKLWQFSIIGGVLGGMLAIIGYFIYSPTVDSLIFFVILRIFIGAVVATVAGPIIFTLTGKK